MTVNPIFHPRSKHIAIDYHFVREKVALGTLITQFIRISHQITDIFTKPIAKHSFQLFRSKHGVHSIPSNLKKGEEVDHVINKCSNKCSNNIIKNFFFTTIKDRKYSYSREEEAHHNSTTPTLQDGKYSPHDQQKIS